MSLRKLFALNRGRTSAAMSPGNHLQILADGIKYSVPIKMNISNCVVKLMPKKD